MIIYIILICLALFFIILMSRNVQLHIEADYLRDEMGNSINIRLELKFLKLRREFTVNAQDNDVMKLLEIVRREVTKLKDHKQPKSFLWVSIGNTVKEKFKNKTPGKNKIWQFIYKPIDIESFTWLSKIGTDNAMYTSLLAGSLWGIKGSALSWLSHHLSFHQVKINIHPLFSEKILESNFNCIASIKMVHIILITSYLVYLKIRGWINGSTTGTKSKPRTSY